MIQLKKVTLTDVEGIILPLYENREHQLETTITFKRGEVFEGKKGQSFYITKEDNGLKYIILVGLGKYEEMTTEDLRNAIAKGVKQAKSLKLESIAIEFMDAEKVCTGGRIKAITEAATLSLYEFNKYKSDNKSKDMSISLINVPDEKMEKAQLKLEESLHIAQGVMIARDLVNEPANVIYPETLAEKAQSIGMESGFEVEVFDHHYIQEVGMKAFWEVAKGSDKLPRLIVMRYMGDQDDQEIFGLVGKGLTYDTGGYSLKPSTSMDTMKCDMGGAAAVIGTMSALAKNKVKKNVVAVVAACENAISGGSYKPGDIIGSMAGKTIEVLNTDAEGRLTLVDAITYIIEKEKVDKIVDVATLTGAVLVALGQTTTGVVTNNPSFYAELEAAANLTGERVWQLPAFDEYKKLIKGDLADLKNIGGRNAGTITAGLFIGEFVGEKPWMHLDVAGTAWADAPHTDYMIKGGTGAPVRTLYQLVKGPCGCHK